MKQEMTRAERFKQLMKSLENKILIASSDEKATQALFNACNIEVCPSIKETLSRDEIEMVAGTLISSILSRIKDDFSDSLYMENFFIEHSPELLSLLKKEELH